MDLCWCHIIDLPKRGDEVEYALPVTVVPYTFNRHDLAKVGLMRMVMRVQANATAQHTVSMSDVVVVVVVVMERKLQHNLR